MGRPSLAGQRRQEILAAFERCVLRDGLAATTVRAVAEETGCQRTLINHYFGDMEGLVGALVTTLTEELTRSFREATASSPSAKIQSFDNGCPCRRRLHSLVAVTRK